MGGGCRDHLKLLSQVVDEVPMSVLVRCRDHLAQPVELLVNAVSKDGWPARWKRADILPLWKKRGSRDDPRTYRPISLLPAISRVAERLLAAQLKGHVRRTGTLPEHQHGFTPHRSCETAVLHLVEMVASQVEAAEVQQPPPKESIRIP